MKEKKKKRKSPSPPAVPPPAIAAASPAVAHPLTCGCAKCKPGAQAGKSLAPVRLCAHRGEPVRVGPYEVLAGGTRDLRSEDLEKADLLVPLLENVPFAFGRRYEILAAPLRDFGGVPEGWSEFVESVCDELALGRRILTFCMGGHGRTGTMLASLIAVLETAKETPDPIAAARERHCERAVETLAQCEAIFALRGMKVPAKYRHEFRPPSPLLGGFGQFSRLGGWNW